MPFENRIYNFAPGPATLPEEVLQTASKDILLWQGIGAGVMEISHRSPAFMNCYQEALQNLIDLMKIPPNYKVLFLQGGGIGQNAAIPMNLMGLAKAGPQADFVVSGVWAQKSVAEASKYGQARVVATSKEENFSCVPARDSWTKTRPLRPRPKARFPARLARARRRRQSAYSATPDPTRPVAFRTLRAGWDCGRDGCKARDRRPASLAWLSPPASRPICRPTACPWSKEPRRPAARPLRWPGAVPARCP